MLTVGSPPPNFLNRNQGSQDVGTGENDRKRIMGILAAKSTRRNTVLNDAGYVPEVPAST